ncbi:class I SAM-dependent methyltransferase [Pseudoxanthomonas gei]|uniref:Class I SAM-dependent methyltransferase n=1 Tax=Pseudoxanthomonas gei TaxID=1383030 RepID=A0ABX0AHV9_9GAMM|nr:class I SAM-dependent methyltransferase [Pseudoxanthomonas gei]NDK40045.1 class I SAM-dependent methyltransferase [Pseudoxanthomonas gei]
MSDYSGTDNLEVMAEAVNYNDFLSERVLRLASGTKNILDFGAGIGTFAQRLRDSGFSVLCLEPDAAQAAKLRSDGMLVCESMASVPAGSVDYIYTLNVLEHIDDDGEALAQIAAALRPGGRLLVYVPAFQVLYSGMDRKVGHVRRYRRLELQSKVAAAGFTGIKARYVDSIGFFAALAYRAMERGEGDGGINLRALKFYDRFIFPLSRVTDHLFGLLFGKNVILTSRKG